LRKAALKMVTDVSIDSLPVLVDGAFRSLISGNLTELHMPLDSLRKAAAAVDSAMAVLKPTSLCVSVEAAEFQEIHAVVAINRSDDLPAHGGAS